ncbi:MAG: AAA family ATPase [Acidobacteriia bacterium]|nr:AAA family ATPase [Terriglobia bacterium]
MVGAPKSGKTLLAVQCALAVASGTRLFDHYRVLEPGPTLIVEQDDPAGASSVKTILQRSKMDTEGIPFYLVPRVRFSFGLEFLQWLEGQVGARQLHLVVLDSYTALRGSRRSGVDIVKAEQSDLNLLDDARTSGVYRPLEAITAITTASTMTNASQAGKWTWPGAHNSHRAWGTAGFWYSRQETPVLGSPMLV